MLYAITDSTLLPGKRLFEGVEAALKGGCRWVQYRDKSNDTRQRLYDARELRALCQQYHAHFIVNDDIALALAVSASGVHLGQGDDSIQYARSLLGESAIIGRTCHDQLHLAHEAIEQGTDYVAFGRFFPSITKPSAQAASLALWQEASQLNVPTVAIGGITQHNAQTVVDTGASLIAICNALWCADNIEQAARYFSSMIRSNN